MSLKKMKTKEITKTNVLLLFLVLSINFTFAQTPSWKWVKNFNGNRNDNGKNVAIDVNQNVYITGTFVSDSLTFGNVKILNSKAGEDDILIAKFNSNGVIQWSINGGGTLDDIANDIAVDGNNDIIVAGYFSSPTCKIGSTILSNASVTGSCGFILKINSANGNIIWSKVFGKTGSTVEASTLKIEPKTNNIIIGGLYTKGIEFNCDTLTPVISPNGFVAKFDNNGNCLFAKSYGIRSITTLAIDANNNIIIGGLGNTVAVNIDSVNIPIGIKVCIVKLNSKGTAIWGISASSTKINNGNWIFDLDVDKQGDIYAVGNYNSNDFTFGNLTPVNPSGGEFDIFVFKINSIGIPQYIKSYGSTKDDGATSICVNPNGNLIIAGYFKSKTINLGSFTLNNPSAYYTSEIFASELNSNGDVIWAERAGGNLYDRAKGVVTNGSDIYVTGYANNEATFGTDTIYNNGTESIFIAKISGTTSKIFKDKLKSSFVIFPNPASNELNIVNNLKQNFSVDIFNSKGEKLGLLNFSEEKYKIEIDNFEKGIYYLKIFNNQISTTKIFIKN